MKKNTQFASTTPHDHLREYAGALAEGLSKVDPGSMALAQSSILTHAKRPHRIFVAGNGGSSAIANHLECDFRKGATIGVVHSLTSNMAVLTAFANDVSYDECFVEQLKSQFAGPHDLLILISSSGNSPNVIRAAEYARSKGIPTIGLSGFDGGQLRFISSISLHVPINNYGVVEDAHQAIMHSLTQYHFQCISKT